MASAAAAELVLSQAMNLCQTLTGKIPDGEDQPTTGATSPQSAEEMGKHSLSALLYQAYGNAKANCARMEKALSVCTSQLNDGKSDLEKAEIKLKSLQSQLAAANAAAFAP